MRKIILVAGAGRDHADARHRNGRTRAITHKPHKGKHHRHQARHAAHHRRGRSGPKGDTGPAGAPGQNGQNGAQGPAGQNGQNGDSYLQGAYYSVAYYDVGDTNGGAIATVACKAPTRYRDQRWRLD